MAEGIRFDWNDANINHIARHKVIPKEAEQAISNDPVDVGFQVVGEEERWLAVGLSNAGRFLTIAWILRGEAIRVITARDSTKEEQAAYWAEKGF